MCWGHLCGLAIAEQVWLRFACRCFAPVLLWIRLCLPSMGLWRLHGRLAGELLCALPALCRAPARVLSRWGGFATSDLRRSKLVSAQMPHGCVPMVLPGGEQVTAWHPVRLCATSQKLSDGPYI